MLNRRQLLIAGFALPVASLGASGAGALNIVVPRVVLVDRRHAASRAFGASFAIGGARLVACDGDVSVVWHDIFESAGGGTAAGLTTPATLHCLERLALARGLRVVVRETGAAADPAWRYDAAGWDDAPLLRWVIAGRSHIGS